MKRHYWTRIAQTAIAFGVSTASLFPRASGGQSAGSVARREDPMRTTSVGTRASRSRIGADAQTEGGGFPAGWQTGSPREEVRPRFAFDRAGGPKKDGCF